MENEVLRGFLFEHTQPRAFPECKMPTLPCTLSRRLLNLFFPKHFRSFMLTLDSTYIWPHKFLLEFPQSCSTWIPVLWVWHFTAFAPESNVFLLTEWCHPWLEHWNKQPGRPSWASHHYNIKLYSGVSERQLGEAENSRQPQDENGVFSLIHWLKVSHRGCWFNQNPIPMQRRTDPCSEMPFLLSFPTVNLPLAAFDVFLNSHPTSKCDVILRTENRRPKRKSRQDTKLKVGCQWRGRPEKPEPRR